MAAIDAAIKHFKEKYELRSLEVKEWGNENGPLKIYVTPTTLRQKQQIFKQIQKHGELEALAHIICIKAFDAEGKKLFDSGDWIELINKVDPVVITDVANKIIRLGEGRTEEGDESDIEEIKKN